MERGFKSWCEQYAENTRNELGLKAEEPLCPRMLASHLCIAVKTPEEIPGVADNSLKILSRNDGTKSVWSAITIIYEGRVLIILNSAHSAGRQSNDLMHELAHRIRKHEPQSVSVSSDSPVMLLRSYDKEHEDEADWLGATMLLPRKALVYIKKKKLTDEDASRAYGVSKALLKYRMSITGVNQQFRKRAAHF